MFGRRCDYCPGTVREVELLRRTFVTPEGARVLELVPIGACDVCAALYQSEAVMYGEELASRESWRQGAPN